MGRPKNDERIESDEDLVALGRADLVSFSRWPLGYKNAYTLAAHQVEWQEKTQAAYLNNLRLWKEGSEENQYLGILAPSEHGKTYGMVIPFIIWCHARNRNIRIGICGSKDDLAASIGYGIDRLYKAHGEDLAKFGIVPDYPWNAEDKYLQRDDDRLIHPSMKFFGPGNELQGVRFDIIVFTDVFTMKNNKTVEGRAGLIDWIDETALPRLEPWGFALMEGHHVGEDDCYCQLMDSEGEWKFVKYSSIVEDPKPENNWTGKTLWPERWPYKKLNRIRQRRPSVFELIYQNNPIARAGFTTRENLDRCLDRGRALLNHGYPDLRSAYKKIYLSLDPAFSIKRGSAHSVCLIWGILEDEDHEVSHRDLLGGWRLKLLPPQLKSKVVATILAWDLDAAFIEANAAQIFAVDEIRKKLGKKAGLVKSVYTLSNNIEESVEAYVGEAVNLIEMGAVTLPYSDAEGRRLSDQILTELINFGQIRTKDALMSWQILERGMDKSKHEERKTTKFAGIAGARRALGANNVQRVGQTH